MEHRYSHRVAVDIQALIYKSGLPIAVGWVRDMSKHGVFIDCEPDTAILNQPLEIQLLFGGKRNGQSRLFKSFVAREDVLGIGLCIFDDHQNSFARYAQSILDTQSPSLTNPAYIFRRSAAVRLPVRR